jgi:hypothetical protein
LTTRQADHNDLNTYYDEYTFFSIGTRKGCEYEDELNYEMLEQEYMEAERDEPIVLTFKIGFIAIHADIISVKRNLLFYVTYVDDNAFLEVKDSNGDVYNVMNLNQQQREISKQMHLYYATMEHYMIKRIRDNKHIIKKTIKKSLKLFEIYGVIHLIKDLMSYKEIILTHEKSKLEFHIQKNKTTIMSNMLVDTIEKNSHRSFSISLFSKQHNIKISDMCVFIDNTPILDQLLAFIMFVKTGNENVILMNSNFPNKNKILNLKNANMLNSSTTTLDLLKTFDEYDSNLRYKFVDKEKSNDLQILEELVEKRYECTLY